MSAVRDIIITIQAVLLDGTLQYLAQTCFFRNNHPKHGSGIQMASPPYILIYMYIYTYIYVYIYTYTVFVSNFNSNSNTCQVYSQSTVNHHPDLLPTHTATASVVPIHIAGSFRFEAFRATRPETIARNRQYASWYLVCSHAFYSNNFLNHVVCNDLNTLSKEAPIPLP